MPSQNDGTKNANQGALIDNFLLDVPAAGKMRLSVVVWEQF